MNDSIRKALLLGIGAATYSKRRAEEVVREFISENNINKEEGEAMVKEYLDRVDKFADEQSKSVKNSVEKAIEKYGLATKKDIQELRNLIEGKETKPSKSATKKRASTSRRAG